MVHQLMTHLQCGFDGVVYIAARFFKERYTFRPDILGSVPKAVEYYAEDMREAEDYLQRCKHPLFRAHAGTLTPIQEENSDNPGVLTRNLVELVMDRVETLETLANKSLDHNSEDDFSLLLLDTVLE